jgi:cbb3-type cytochrome oxidase subunit 3
MEADTAATLLAGLIFFGVAYYVYVTKFKK